MTSTSETVAESLVQETRTKRRRIATSLWPRARLFFEIFYHEVERDHVFTQASALTYKTLFSLLPVFVLSLMILSVISTEDQFEKEVQESLFQQMGLSSLTIQTGSAPATPDGADPAPLPPAGIENAAGAAPQSGGAATQPQTLATFVKPFVAKARAQISSTATGLIAFAVLLYGAISLMIVIEETFNQIYGTVKPRSWPRRLMLYWCVLTLGPLGVAGSIVLGGKARAMVDTASGGHAIVASTATALSGFFVSWLLILLLYRLVPDSKVKWQPLLTGSFLAAVSWELGKWAFGLYVRYAAASSWYGSLALLPLFMFWIYITWSVVLMGLEFTFIQQYWPLLKRQYFFSRGATGRGHLSDLRWVLSLGVLIYRQFKQGKVTDVSDAAEMLMIPNDVTGQLLNGLATAGLLHEVREGSYALARPPESITAHDLLTAARSLCQVPPELAREVVHASAYPISPGVQELEHLENTWAKSQNLPALAGDMPQAS